MLNKDEKLDYFNRQEILLIALVLVAAYHALPLWLSYLFPARQVYEYLGEDGYSALYSGVSGIAPLLLCLATPWRSGLRLGNWKGHGLKVLGICALPVILTAIVYPYTSKPFSGGSFRQWLVSPLSQDLLFTGYLFGLLNNAFPGTINKRIRVKQAVILTALFFALWHVPNFHGIPASYVSFQLFYTFVGGAWTLLARQLTGSILPGLVVHMAVNYIASL